jgi:hypothetical protein
MNDIEIIKTNIQIINNVKSKIFEYINKTRYQSSLIKNLNIWNQICSSLYVIGDTLISIEEYLNNDFPKSDGLKYIFTYGILQSLFIQQDATKNLLEAFNIKVTFSETLKKIRDIRNSSIGHPTKQEIKGKNDKKVKIFYHYISRISLCKEGFTLQKTNIEQRNDIFIDINLIEIIKNQIDEIIIIFNEISALLVDNDKNHKNKYKEELMVNIFPVSLNYSFEKIGEAIYFSGYGKKDFGLTMLKIIEDSYIKFENELIKRNELPGNEYLLFDLNQYKHAIVKIRDYLSDNISKMEESDARIYLFYLKEEHNNFIKIANEYDEDYNE